MPVYDASPVAKTPLAMPGTSVYVWGSKNQDISNSRLFISNVVLATNVVTLTVQVVEGPIPAVGSLITVTGTTRGSGACNVTAVALTDVTIASTGAGTVSYALTNADIPTHADGGVAYVETPVVYESVTAATSSQVVALSIPANGGVLNGLSAEVVWETAPTAAVVAVQVADKREEKSFVTVDTLTFTGSPMTTLRSDPAGLTANFARLQLVSHTGSEKIAGRILIR